MSEDYSKTYVVDVREFHKDGMEISFEELTVCICESDGLAEAWAKQLVDDYDAGLPVDVFGSELQKHSEDGELAVTVATLKRWVECFGGTYQITSIRQEF